MNNYDQIVSSNNPIFGPKTVDGTNTTILLNSGYIIKFSKITIFEDDKNSSKIIYMHGPYEYSIEYFEAEDHRENQYLTGPKSVEIVKMIIEDASTRNLDIIASGIIRGIERRKNVHIDDVNASGDITERERKRMINQGRRSTDKHESEKED
jgi:hypothetical protein